MLVLSVVSAVLVGVAQLRAGLAGAVVEPPGADLTVEGWFLSAPFAVGWIAVLALGWWARAAAVLLVLARTPTRPAEQSGAEVAATATT